MAEADQIQEYQHLLNKLPGILSSRIITDSSHTITEIHILSDLSRGPKQVVRDVQSALSAKYDMTVDHKIISVAQVEEGGLAVREARLVIDSIRVRSELGKVDVSVVLSRDEQMFEGNASGGNSAQGRLRVVADAALQAVHRFLNKDFLFVLSDAIKIDLADRKAIAVSILHFTNYGEEYLSGSAIIKTDENEAVVKATLDAVNRRLFQHYLK